MQFMDEIQQISIQASQERSLRQQLQAQEDVWKRIDFIIKPYKQKDNILGDVEEIYVSLDECLANINMILGNRENDAIAYLTAGIPKSKIFIIDKQSEVHQLSDNENPISYL